MDFLPFAKLSNVSVPPRVRSILESAYQQLWKASEPTVKATLDEFERDLFRLAEKAGTNDAQNRIFEALKDSRKKNSQVLIRFRNAIQAASLALLTPRVEEIKPGQKRTALSLVENAALEEELAVSEISARSEIKCTQQLSYLAVRFAVVTGGAPVAIDALPCGPRIIMRAIAEGAEIFEMPPALKVEFLRTFDRQFMSKLPDLLDKINEQMREQRVFANLDLGLNRRAGPEPRAAEPRAAEPKVAEAKADAAQAEKAQAPSEVASNPANSGFAQSPNPAQNPTPNSASKPFNVLKPSGAPSAPTPAKDASNPFAPAHDFGFAGAFDTGFGENAGSDALNSQPRELASSPASRSKLGNPAQFPRSAPAEQPQPSTNQPTSSPMPTRHGFSGLPSFAPNPQAHAPTPLRAGGSEQNTPLNADMGDTDTELFSTLRELLGGKRSNAQASDDVTVPSASPEDLQSVLTVLQSQTQAPVMSNGRWVTRRVSHIKQDLQSQLRQLNGGKAIKLKAEDSDTCDLVGMLFDHLLQDIKPSASSHTLINKLQVPVMKVALSDKSFFSRRNHPARRLLNSISETSLFLMDDEVDQPLLERMHLVVDRVISDYDQDHTIFETMLGDLNRHVNTLQRKAEVSEKRYIDAAKGRERLEVARQTATIEIEKQTRGKLLPELVLHLLESAWADVLALTQLREGIDSADFQERLLAAEQVSRCFDLDNPVSKSDFQDVRPVLEEGMSLVGFHSSEIERTLNAVEELVVDGEAILPSLEPAEERVVTELVKSKSRLGAPREDKHSDTAPAAGESVLDAIQTERQSLLSHPRGKESKLPLGAKEQQMFEKIKQLPFGTWFEFTINQQGEKVRRKLSWFSPVTSKCLFVNARGAKAEERSLEQLARDLVRGNAAIWEQEDLSLIDRAWRSIKETLKGITGRSTGDEEITEATA